MTNNTSSKFNRRAFLKTAGAGAAATAVLAPSTVGALTKETTAPAIIQGAGFYRFPLGTKTITVLADGNADFPGQALCDQLNTREIR